MKISLSANDMLIIDASLDVAIQLIDEKIANLRSQRLSDAKQSVIRSLSGVRTDLQIAQKFFRDPASVDFQMHGPTNNPPVGAQVAPSDAGYHRDID